MPFFPEEGEVGWCFDVVDVHVVLVVLFCRLPGFAHETEPDTPLVLERGLHHLLHMIINQEIK